MKAQDGEFFTRLSHQQTPKILWIGCSDSRVPVNQITGSLPGEVFVHRNIANIVAHGDLNCLAVMYYAVAVLKVEHIVVCGHYGCGGVMAAMETQPHGLIDDWLLPIKDIIRLHEEELAAVPAERRADVLCELNVKAQLRYAADSDIVKAAWQRGQRLTLHGWIYGIRDGIIRELMRVDGEGDELHT